MLILSEVIIWNLNLRHLRALASIARLGSISAAAEAINLTQPAITQALAKFETHLGQPFFERRANGMTATPAEPITLAASRFVSGATEFMSK